MRLVEPYVIVLGSFNWFMFCICRVGAQLNYDV